MYALVRYERSIEGGPDIEFVCGIFEERSQIVLEKARKLILRNLNPDTFESVGYVPVEGRFSVQTSWAYHGEHQNELLTSLRTFEEAKKRIGKENSGTELGSPCDYYIHEYRVGELKCW